MATYPVIHKKTGEQKEVAMSITEWSKWCDDNPDWQRDWSDPSTMPGWNEILGRAQKTGRNRQKLTLD